LFDCLFPFFFLNRPGLCNSSRVGANLKFKKGLNMTKEEIAQTIRDVKERQRRGKQIRAKEAAERAAKDKSATAQLTPEQVEAVIELNKSQKIDAGSDYEALILAYKKKNDCSYLEATQAVARLPNIRVIKESWIQKKNAEREAARGAPQPIEKIDGKNFIEWVAFFKLNHGMSAQEAGQHIDKTLGRGLRLGYINSVNK
jgi:hypothetical protein